MYNDEPLISIIVPVYNSSSYIGNCISSILKQTYRNIELILIDDGSTDNSKSICIQYANKDKRIKYFYQRNKGVSAARNYGLEKSKGLYIVFVDSDDMIDISMVEELHDCMITQKVKVVMTSGSIVYQDASRKRFAFFNEFANDLDYIQLSQKEIISQVLRYACSSVWGMMYDRAVIENIRFNESLSNKEDMLFNIQVYLNVPEVYCVNKNHYYYFQHEDSLSKPSYKKTMMYLKVLSIIKSILSKEYENDIKSFSIISHYMIASRLVLSREHTLEYQYSRNYLKQNIKDIKNYKIVIDKEIRKRILLLVYFPTVFKVVKRYR